MSERIDLSAADFWELQAMLYKVENIKLALDAASREALAKVQALGVDVAKPWKLDGPTKTIVVE